MKEEWVERPEDLVGGALPVGRVEVAVLRRTRRSSEGHESTGVHTGVLQYVPNGALLTPALVVFGGLNGLVCMPLPRREARRGLSWLRCDRRAPPLVQVDEPAHEYLQNLEDDQKREAQVHAHKAAHVAQRGSIRLQ